MVNRLIVEGSDMFAAFAPSSPGGISLDDLGEDGDYKPDDFTPRPVIQILGSLDPKLTYAAGVEEFSTDESAADDGNPVRERYIGPQLEILGLMDDYTYENNGKVSHFTFSESAGAASEAEYQLFMVEDMKHIYPNGSNYRFIAADLYWDFFEQYSL